MSTYLESRVKVIESVFLKLSVSNELNGIVMQSPVSGFRWESGKVGSGGGQGDVDPLELHGSTVGRQLYLTYISYLEEVNIRLVELTTLVLFCSWPTATSSTTSLSTTAFPISMKPMMGHKNTDLEQFVYIYVYADFEWVPTWVNQLYALLFCMLSLFCLWPGNCIFVSFATYVELFTAIGWFCPLLFFK